MKKFFVLFFFLFFINIANAKVLDIPFISQVPPGDWDNSLNCGQASYYMADNYLSEKNKKLNPDKIKNIDDFLYKIFKDPIRNYNGSSTNIDKLKRVAEDMDGYSNVSANRGKNDFDVIKRELDNGNMIVVLVRISMKQGLDGHFMLFTGYDDNYVYFNDPGKVFGKNYAYNISDFLKVWKSKNYNYLLIKKEKEGQERIEEQNQKSADNVVYEIKHSNQNSIINIMKNFSNNVGYGFYNTETQKEENKQNEKNENNNIIPEFIFIDKYKDGRLVVPFEFYFDNLVIDDSKYYFEMDYKINEDGEWNNLFSEFNLHEYNYFIKTNGDEYFFRIRACNEYNYCSDYKETNHFIYLKPETDMGIVGYSGNDIVLDRDVYRNVCFNIDEDQVVLITSGTKIILSPNCNMVINGYLFAMGEENKRIEFTSMDDSVQSYWEYISFQNSFGSILNYVDFSNGGYYAFRGKVFPMLDIENSIVMLDNVTFSESAGSVTIRVIDNSAFYLLNSKIEASIFDDAIQIYDSIGIIENNLISGGVYGIQSNNCDDKLIIKNNKIKNMEFVPVRLINSFPEIGDNILQNNKMGNVIFLKIDLQGNVSKKLKKEEYVVEEFIVSNNSSLEIEPGTILKSEGNKIYKIQGELIATGEENNPIIFTDTYDDFWGESVKHINGNWSGIDIIDNNKEVKIINCIILNSIKNGVDIENSSNVNIKNSILENNNLYGIKINNSNNINIKDVLIIDSEYGVYSKNSEVFLENNIYNNVNQNEKIE